MDGHTLADGYYWCDHDLGYWVPLGSTLPKRWCVIEVVDDWLYLAGSEHDKPVADAPDYVSFVGPLAAPGDGA